MLLRVLFAWSLLALTVTVHAAGLAVVLRRVLQSWTAEASFWPVTWLLVRVAGLLIVLHLAEIALWAIFYFIAGCLPDLESSFYFSGVTYTTLGYGDLVLPAQWRVFGPLEGLTGILMCGLSVSFFVAIVGKIFASGPKRNDRANNL